MRSWVPLLLSSLIVLGGCGAKPPVGDESAASDSQATSPLVGKRWKLTLIGTDERWQGQRDAYFELTPSEGGVTLAGSDGCNRLTGEATLGESRRIAISELASTRMACPGLPQSARLGTLLDRAYRYLIDHDRLVLLGRDGRVLGGFKQQKSPE
ncbi:Heat shock protein HslJ [Modicisalibacter ilicicola DSM 19980]|uniref:Heat shock protein HslJ n=1 Tax=Modicisalibacter ilicicola DSM 19980 TaxID=1121942 RepID=A0A1M5EUZ4_9GAMM|nr:META domain-containing protein [Halomonas ilicicola]SHF82901.1 Heat shock protein HslJ [Halomonas ilicicola DSM 19980]